MFLYTATPFQHPFTSCRSFQNLCPCWKTLPSYNYTTVATDYNETTSWDAWGMGL